MSIINYFLYLMNKILICNKLIFLHAFFLLYLHENYYSYFLIFLLPLIDSLKIKKVWYLYIKQLLLNGRAYWIWTSECQSQSLMPYRLAKALKRMVERDGFEPSNSLRVDLQSTAFSHFAISPSAHKYIISIAILLYYYFSLLSIVFFNKISKSALKFSKDVIL